MKKKGRLYNNATYVKRRRW